MSNISDFEKYWDKFTTKLRGMLMNQSQKQTLTYSIASIILSDAAVSWSLSYDECGIWLIKYTEGNPEKGELISQVLTGDMKFKEIPPKKDIPESANIITPLVGAILGGGIAHILDANVFVQIASAIVPAALLYPAIKSVGNMVTENNKDGIIDEYMAQLEKYKKSVIVILSE